MSSSSSPPPSSTTTAAAAAAAALSHPHVNPPSPHSRPRSLPSLESSHLARQQQQQQWTTRRDRDGSDFEDEEEDLTPRVAGPFLSSSPTSTSSSISSSCSFSLFEDSALFPELGTNDLSSFDMIFESSCEEKSR